MIHAALAPVPAALITVFGLGRLRPASGTWGSLPPVLLAAAMLAAGLGTGVLYHAVLLLTLGLFSLACILFGDRAEARFDGKDPSEVVADEAAGMCLPLLVLPAAAVTDPARAAFTLVYAFLCFRAMDILKPWPCNGLQKHPAGWGILLDDLAAGLLAMLAVQVVTRGFM